MEKFNQRTIVLRSSDRISGTINKFTCRLNHITNIKGFSVKSMSVPISYYQITSSNNTFVMVDTATTTSYTIVVDDGVYSSSDIETVLKTKLDATASAIVFTVSVNPYTEKLTISGTAAFSLDFTNTNYLDLIGFNNITYASATSITAPNVMDLNKRYNGFNVYSDKLSRGSAKVNTSSFQNSQLILVCNNPSANVFQNYVYSNDDNANSMLHYKDTEHLETIDIEIRDAQNKPIDFNGVDTVNIILTTYS